MSGALVDLLVAGFLGFATWRGWRRGLVRGIAKLLGLIVATAAAALLHGPIGALVAGLGVPERYDDLAGAVTVFIGVLIAFRFVGNSIAKALRFTKIGTLVDAGSGAALAGFWALSLLSLILIGVSVFESSAAAAAVEQSTLGNAIVETAPEVAETLTGADLRGWLMRILGSSAN